jgi:tetratricopeptide (TPR) repeat protein
MPAIVAHPTTEIPHPDILAALARVASSAPFLHSVQLQRLLRFLVEETLAGRGDRLKEYVIGVEVFGRPSSFDPHLDSLVRVEARRLRGALETYYRTEGFGDPILVEVPKGGYHPVFRRRVPAASSAEETSAAHSRSVPPASDPKGATRTSIREATPSRTPIAAVALVLGACVGVMVVLAALGSRGAPVEALTDRDSIVIAGFANSTGEPVFDHALKQGLVTELEQSPFLNVVSESRVEQVLRQMRRSSSEQNSPQVARELCVRAGSAAIIQGSIDRLGSHYVIGLTATSCSTGEALTHVQAEANRKEAVLKALTLVASRIRARLGESRSSIQEFETPLEEATTASLEALQAYTLGRRTARQAGSPADVPYLRRAVELDPDFAIAHAALGVSYINLAEAGLAATHLKRAYDLRDRVTERERCRIAAYYHHVVTGDLAKATEAYQVWIRSYPRDYAPFINMGLAHLWLGEYDKALAETKEALRLEPGSVLPYSNVAALYIKLEQPQEARSVLNAAQSRNLTSRFVRSNLCYLAFLASDQQTVDRQLSDVLNRPGDEDLLLSQQSDTEAFYGRLENARELSRRAVESATHAGANEAAAVWQANAALRESEFGNVDAARQAVSAALRLASSRDVLALTSLASARAGDMARAGALLADLEAAYPQNSVIRLYWSPTIRAAIQVSRDPRGAMETLRAVVPYERGSPPPLGLATLYPVYLRGEAYLLAKQAGAAATEFQKLLDHPGLVLNFPLRALSYLQLGRALAASGERAGARAAYDEFLTIWRGADVDIPILRRARIERAGLR